MNDTNKKPQETISPKPEEATKPAIEEVQESDLDDAAGGWCVVNVSVARTRDGE